MKNKSLQFVAALMPPDKKKQYENESKLFFCESCKRVYEPYSVNGRLKEAHFKDMPSLHLPRKDCMSCTSGKLTKSNLRK